ncbi:hypothetical protein CRYUN_Cryun04dG0190000 [Craigia yunnanensis]
MSNCLPQNPWRMFPFTTFVEMLSALVTLVVDSFAMSMYKKRSAKALVADNGEMLEKGSSQMENFGHGHGHAVEKIISNDGQDDKESQLLRHRVIAQVLELGIIVHSVVIGLAIGDSDNPCTMKQLIAAICFHQNV